MTIFGKYNEDGSVAREATECILTGMAVSKEDGSIRENVKGTPYFYRVHGSQYENLTDEHRALLTQQVKVNPDMTWEQLDLKQLRRVDDKPVVLVVPAERSTRSTKLSEVRE